MATALKPNKVAKPKSRPRRLIKIIVSLLLVGVVLGVGVLLLLPAT